MTPLLVANTVLLIAYAIFAETFITFLGLGDPATISWGSLIENAFKDDAIINKAWWAVLPPGICVMLVVLSCTIIGQTIEDALNPRLRTGHLSVRRFRVLPRSGAAGATTAVVTQPLLEVEDLNVWFDLPNGRTLHAVQGVSFSVDAGTRLGMVGESGCGKTTTILALMGLLPPTASVSGRVAFEGVDVLERGEQTIAPHRWKDIAMVFQGAMNAFDPVKRIGEQIVEPMELHGNASGQARRRPASASCSRRSASRPGGRGAIRTSSPAECASARRSRWRSPATRASCSRTSRRPRST